MIDSGIKWAQPNDDQEMTNDHAMEVLQILLVASAELRRQRGSRKATEDDSAIGIVILHELWLQQVTMWGAVVSDSI